MTRVPFLVGVVLVGGWCLTGCSDDVTGTDPDPDFRPLAHPDSVMRDFVLSYRRREIGPYARLLSTDFRFHFLPADAPDIPDGEWNRDQDSTGTYRLFNDVEVVRITLDLQWSDPVPDTLRGVSVQRVETTVTDLRVDIDGGNTTLQVRGDLQRFYFVQGREAMGESPDRWYLFDWQDWGAQDRRLEGGTGWSSIKSSFR